MKNKILLAAMSVATLCADTSAPPQMESSKIKCQRDENHFFVEADFIYWFAKQEGNEFAADGAAITVPGTTDPNTLAVPGSISSGKLYALDNEWKPGFKAGAGVLLAHGGWDLFAQYTYFYNKSSKSVHSDNVNSGIIPIFTYTPNNSIFTHATFAATADATGFVSNATAHGSLHFNTMNLELGKNLVFCPTFLLRPHFGLKGAWQEQKFDAIYTVSNVTTPASTLGKNKVTFDQHSWGIGLRAGVDTEWNFWKHFGLFANSAASVLYSQFKSHGKSFDTNAIAGYSDVLIANQTYRPHLLVPVLELETGFQYIWMFGNDCRFVLQAGWEGQMWFFQNQHSSTIANTSLTLQGLTTTVRFDF